MAAMTRRRVCSLTTSGRLSTLLTVPRDTPACRATSLMLAVAIAPLSPALLGFAV